MERRESEIFNEYVKLAEHQGLVKESDYADARIGTDTPSVIEMLYGVRPNDEKKNQTYSPLLDQAHPDPAVVAPAHDRMDGVVEDLKQRQSIMTQIALKTPDGALIHRRFIQAHDDLLNSLVRAGFTLDNEQQPELQKMADGCTDELVKSSIAWLAALPWIARGLGFALAGAAIINHTPNSRQGVAQNSQQVLDLLSDLKNHPLSRIVKNDVSELKYLAAEIKPIEADLASVYGLAKASSVHEEDLNRVKKYMVKLSEVHEKIPEWIKLAQQTETTESGSADWWQKIKDVAGIFTGTDVSNIVNALEGLDKAIVFASSEIGMYLNKAAEANKNISQYLSNNPHELQNVASSMGTGVLGEISGLVSRVLG